MVKMKAYKGFRTDMTCLGFQYREGGKYTTDKAELCERGFHACKNPLDCLNYYGPGGSVYHEVELGGDIKESNFGSKAAATQIKIGERLSISEIVNRAVDYVRGMTNVSASASAGDMSPSATTGNAAHSVTTGPLACSATTGDAANSATTGYMSHSATTGYKSHSSTTGPSAHSATTGNAANSVTTGVMSHSVTTGYEANSVTTGDNANSVTTGDNSNSVTIGDDTTSEVWGKGSIAAVFGFNCKARGSLGCWLVLTERGYYRDILDIRAVKVDGETIKANVWYALHDGNVVEVGEGEVENNV